MKKVKKIAPEVFMVFARYGIEKHFRETKENYRKEVEKYIEKFLRVIH